VHSHSLKNRFLFIHEKNEIKFFYALAYAFSFKKSKNIVLMYSSMHSHIKKNYALIHAFLKKSKNEKQSYMHFHIIIHSINKNEKYTFFTCIFIIHYASSKEFSNKISCICSCILIALMHFF